MAQADLEAPELAKSFGAVTMSAPYYLPVQSRKRARQRYVTQGLPFIAAGSPCNRMWFQLLMMFQYFDIIGLDPRGINNTRPLILCYPDRLAGAAAKIESSAHGYIGTSDTAFDNLWASKRAVAESCSKRAIDDVSDRASLHLCKCGRGLTIPQGIGMHMGTAPVARDVIEIFERHGEWRVAEAERLLKSMTATSNEEKKIIRARIAYRPGKEMVQYWGFVSVSILSTSPPR